MWTQVSLSLHHVWEDVLWRATAIWDDGAGTDPVVLSLAGRASASANDSPAGLLESALAALDRELERERGGKR